MHVNEGYDIGIVSLLPQGTNSTMFTQCCSTAICDSEQCCPACGRKIVGWDAGSEYKRGRIRWSNATRLWNR